MRSVKARPTGGAALRTIRLGELPSGSTWVGAVSFEQRCTESLKQLVELGPIGAAHLIDYGTRVLPIARSDHYRNKNRRELVQAARDGSAPVVRKTLYPYQVPSGLQFFDAVAEDAIANDIPALVFDVSCFTKLHALAWAVWCHERSWKFGGRIFLANTTPLQYAWQERQSVVRGDYRDVVFTSVGRVQKRQLANEWRSAVDVVCLLGHEGLRLRLALSSLEILRGMAVLSSRPDGSDVGLMAQLENAAFLQDAAANRGADWTLVESMGDPSDISAAIEKFARGTAADRIVIAPLGPKPLVIETALSAFRGLEDSSTSLWVSYPVPQAYSLDYSIGVRHTQFYEYIRR